MAFFDIEHPDTGDIITIESDSAPTQEEAAALIASIPATPQQVAENKYIASQQASVPKKLMNLGAQGLGAVKGLADIIGGGVSGLGEVLGQASVPPENPNTLQDLITRSAVGPIGSIPGIGDTLARALPNLAQSGLEAGSRVAYDVGQMLPNSLEDVIRAGVMGTPGGAQALLALNLIPRTPSRAEAQAAVAKQEEEAQIAQARKAPIAPEVLGTANIPLAEAIPIVAPVAGEIPAMIKGAAAKISRPFQVAGSRGVFSAPLEDAVTRATGITAQEGSMEIVPIAKSRILEATKKAPTTALESFQAATQTEKYLLDKTLNTLKKADTEGLAMSKQEALKSAEDSLRAAQPTITQAEIDSALEYFKRRLPEKITPSEGQKILVEQNDALQTVFAETGVPARKTKGNPAVTARLGIADSFSNQLDDIYKGVSGLDESPYRDWGQVREFKQGLNDQIIGAQRVQGGRAEKGIKSVPVTRMGLIEKAGRVVGRPFIPREIEAVDKGVKRIFKEIPSNPKASALDSTVRQEILDRYKGGSAPTVNIPPPATTPQSLEQAISARIASYPAALKRDPKLARIAAETELGVSPVRAIAPGEAATVPQNIEEAITQSIQKQPAQAIAPAPVPIKSYPPEIQAQLNAAKSKYDSAVEFANRSFSDPGQRQRRLKGYGMEYAAEKRQITGELTGKEASAKAAMEAGNYIGKPVSVNLEGQIVNAQVVGNPFGRVKIKLPDGSTMTVLPENIGPVQ